MWNCIVKVRTFLFVDYGVKLWLCFKRYKCLENILSSSAILYILDIGAVVWTNLCISVFYYFCGGSVIHIDVRETTQMEKIIKLWYKGDNSKPTKKWKPYFHIFAKQNKLFVQICMSALYPF